MKKIEELKIHIFADGADKSSMLELKKLPFIKGFTTNPTLMHKAGIKNYRSFCKDILTHIKDQPISFEVFSDEFDEMEIQAREISSWGENIYVKIPITNTTKLFSGELIKKLVASQIKVNVTAIMNLHQVASLLPLINPSVPLVVSILAGRIADTGRDPVPMMAEAVRMLKPFPHAELLWASPRELLNIFQAEEIGCHIITVTREIIKKFEFINYDLDEFSLDTVKMFYNDAKEAGFSL